MPRPREFGRPKQFSVNKRGETFRTRTSGSPASIRTVIHGDGSITFFRRKLCRFAAQTGLFEHLPMPLMRAERSELLRFRGVNHSSNNWLVPDWIRTLIHV